MTRKLEDNKIWKEANALAEVMYGLLAGMPEEEKWVTQSKMRSAASELIYAVALAIDDVSPTGGVFEWQNARKQVSALMTLYRFVGRQRFIHLEPEIMVRFEALRSDIDTALQAAETATEAQRKANIANELRPWQEKYEIWKRLQGESNG